MNRTSRLVLFAVAVTAACSRAGTPAASSTATSATPDTTAAAAPAAAPAPAPTTATTVSAESTVASAPLRDAYHTAPLDTVDARTYQGWKYFNLNCARCHGEDVQGTTLAPHLIASLKPDGAIPNEGAFLQVVCGGRVEKGMPAWCKEGLSTAQIDTIYAYVKGRSDAKLHPGRPAQRGG